MRRHTIPLILCIFSALSVTSLSAFQPYLPYNPVPIPDIGLNRESSSAFYLETNTIAYGRLAHQCFLDNLKERNPLSALYFNSGDFRLSNIFQDCLVPTNTANYNPYMRVLRLKPQVTYSETGAVLTVRAEAAFGPRKWFHVGIKGSLPFKRREIERKDPGTRDTAQIQDLASIAEVQMPTTSSTTNDVPNASAYRLDFIEAMPAYDNTTTSVFIESISYDPLTGSTNVFTNSSLNNTGSDSIGGAVIVKKESYVPRNDDIAVVDTQLGYTGSSKHATEIDAYLPAFTSQLKTNTVYEIETGVDYTGLLDSTTKTVTQRLKDQDAKATLWVIGSYDNTGNSTDATNDIYTTMTEKIAQYNQNEYEWFHDREYLLESQIADGIGDAKVECYIACDLFDSFQLRLSGGATLPIARQQTVGQNPYAIHLGNRGHLEVFVAGGVTIAVPKTTWFITADAQYNTALNAIENISATPRGAQIKNMGPETRAEIAWHSAQGNVWLHMRHPKTTALVCSIGYDWYAKIEDTLRFLDNNVQSFLGNTFNYSTQKYDISNPMTLDPEVAKNHTSMVAHTLRLATAYTISPFIKIQGQFGYVLAGRNCPQVTECSIGCTISY